MISRDRSECPPCLDLTNPDSPASKELSDLKDLRASGDELKSKDFKVYAKVEVRDTLRDMFDGKCAYCESKIAGSQDTDIEHYRPKGGVTEAVEAGVEHDGYWWLAMEWKNLVLSCQHCNQARSRQIAIPDHVRSQEELEDYLIDPPQGTSGKLNSFPTLDDRWITDPDQDVSDEQPLIINPVDVDPGEHLEWLLDDYVSTAIPKDGSPEGLATIRILGLNRRWLVEDRGLRLREMQLERQHIQSDINQWLATESEEDAERLAVTIERALERLETKAESNQPFAGVARAFLDALRDDLAEM